MRSRMGSGHGASALEIGMHLFSHVLRGSHTCGWRIGNDIKRCTLCGKCQMVCPINAITVSVHNGTWTLNNGRCNHCLKCVIRCPTQCLSQVSL